MQPSSLIFVLVVAIWAVYLLQYWIKRRDHLSTVRSVDRFSEAMRVLDDHRMSRGSAEPLPRSYSVAPTRAARPEVTVKHAVAPPAARAGQPLARPAASSARRLRGLTLLTMLVVLPVAVVAAVLGALPWWGVAAWSLATVACFVWLRRAVIAERAALRRLRTEQRRASASPATTPRVREPAPAPRAQRPAPRGRDAAPTVAAPTAAATAPATRSTRVYDVVEEQRAAQPAEPTAPAARTDASTVEAEPGTWQPTPVPRPMYTMKAKAERPEPAPVETAPVPAADVPQVIDVEDEDLPAIAGWG